MSDDKSIVLSTAAVTLAFLAIIMGTYGMVSCRAVEIPSNSGSSSIEAGLFSYKTVGFVGTSGSDTIYIVDYCLSYKDIRDDFGFDYTEDSLMQSLQAIAITIPILGGIALAGHCITMFAGEIHPQTYKVFGLFYVVCCILQGVGLMMMQSDVCNNNPIVQYLTDVVPAVGNQFQSGDCEFSTGMRMGISATVFWGIAGLLSMAVSKKEEEEMKEEDNKAAIKSVEEEIQEEGNKAVSKSDEEEEEIKEDNKK